jgi:hypothetical protein
MQPYSILATLLLASCYWLLPVPGLGQVSRPDSSTRWWTKHFPPAQFFFGLGLGTFEAKFTQNPAIHPRLFSLPYYLPSTAGVLDLHSELQVSLIVMRADMHLTLARRRVRIANPTVNYGHWHWELHFLAGLGLGLEFFRRVRIAPVAGLGLGADSYDPPEGPVILAHARLPVSVRVWRNLWVGAEVVSVGSTSRLIGCGLTECDENGINSIKYDQSYRFWNFKVIYNLIPKPQSIKPQPERVREPRN